MWWEMKIKNIITLFWNGTDRTWNSKSLRWIQLWGLNLKWQLLFQICGYSLWMCFCTEQGHWHPDFTLQDESDPASFEALGKAPIDFRGRALCPIQGDIISEEQCFWKLQIFACLTTQTKQNISLHVICHGVSEEGCICILHLVQTLIFQWVSDKFLWTIFIPQKTKICSIKLSFLDRSLFPVIVQEVTQDRPRPLLSSSS